MAELAKSVDPRFLSDLLRDGDLLRKYVNLVPENEHRQHLMTEKAQNEAKTILDELDDCDSLQGLFDDEITIFVRAESGDKDVDPLV